MNLPNLITLLRIGLIPVFVVLYVVPGERTNFAAAGVFALASLTDWLDGYLARRLGQTTQFGAFLDPVADKLIVVTALVLLVAGHHNFWLTLPAIIIVGREIVISALREWMAEMNRRGLVQVGIVGKLKTTCQMLAILVLLGAPVDLNAPATQFGYGLLYVAAVLTLWSMTRYVRAAGPTLRTGLAGGAPPEPAPPDAQPERK